MSAESFVSLNLEDVQNGLLFSNFKVENGVPKIITRVDTAKDNLVTDLGDAGKFRRVSEKILIKLVKDGRVVLIGPRGIGKSTLATYVAWRSLLGNLGNVVLDKPPIDTVIRVNSLNPGDVSELNSLVEDTKRRFVVVYDPSPIEAYYKPEAMQAVKHDIESVKNTLKALTEVWNAMIMNTLKALTEVWNAMIIIVLPNDLYEQVKRDKREDVNLKRAIDSLESDVVTVNLKDEEFLGEIIRKYSGCYNIYDDLIEKVMNFDTYTLVAKYIGVQLRESGCSVKDVDELLRKSTIKSKLFFANYIWGTILGKSRDLAKKVSVPLILHATFGPIPEEITYITKAVNEGGVWKLIDRNRLARSKLEDLIEADLKPIAKWLSMKHEDLIEETLQELVGFHDEDGRRKYEDHGLESLIEALDWGYEKMTEEVEKLTREEVFGVIFKSFIFVGERLKRTLIGR